MRLIILMAMASLIGCGDSSRPPNSALANTILDKMQGTPSTIGMGCIGTHCGVSHNATMGVHWLENKSILRVYVFENDGVAISINDMDVMHCLTTHEKQQIRKFCLARIADAAQKKLTRE